MYNVPSAYLLCTEYVAGWRQIIASPLDQLYVFISLLMFSRCNPSRRCIRLWVCVRLPSDYSLRFCHRIPAPQISTVHMYTQRYITHHAACVNWNWNCRCIRRRELKHTLESFQRTCVYCILNKASLHLDYSILFGLTRSSSAQGRKAYHRAPVNCSKSNFNVARRRMRKMSSIIRKAASWDNGSQPSEQAKGAARKIELLRHAWHKWRGAVHHSFGNVENARIAIEMQKCLSSHVSNQRQSHRMTAAGR